MRRRVEKQLERYRANANVSVFHHGQIVEINPSEPAWAGLIAKGYLVPAPPADVDLSAVYGDDVPA